MAVDKVSVALVGGGYTLQLLASRLTPGSFVITSRSADTCADWRSRGWTSAQVDLTVQSSVASFFKQFPGIKLLIDSVPPTRSADPAEGVRAITAELKHSAVSKIVYLSTTGVFGIRDGSVVDETTQPQPWNPQGQARLLCEQAYRETGKKVCALRLPAIYGPDRGVVQSIRHGTYRLIGTGDNWTNRIHVYDLATVLEKLIDTEQFPDVLCVSDDCPARAKEVAGFVCEREGVPFPPSISEADALRQQAFTMLSNQRVSNSLMKKLGMQLRYPSFREGLYG